MERMEKVVLLLGFFEKRGGFFYGSLVINGIDKKK
jgi:hypothetical protein